MIDYEHAMEDVTEALLSSLGLSFDEALAIALGNLANRTDEPLVRVGPSLYETPWADHYDGARALLDGLFDLLDLEGDPVILIPNRLIMIVFGSENSQAALAAADRVMGILDVDRPVSRVPLVWRGRTWEPFVSPDAEVRRAFEKLVVIDRFDAYLDQGELLAAIHGGDKIGAAVPFDDNSALMACWPRGAEVWLPETESVLFMETNDGGFAVPWEEVREVLDSRMTRMEYEPVRWRCAGFPDEDECRTLGAEDPARRFGRAPMPWRNAALWVVGVAAVVAWVITR